MSKEFVIITTIVSTVLKKITLGMLVYIASKVKRMQYVYALFLIVYLSFTAHLHAKEALYLGAPCVPNQIILTIFPDGHPVYDVYVAVRVPKLEEKNCRIISTGERDAGDAL